MDSAASGKTENKQEKEQILSAENVKLQEANQQLQVQILELQNNVKVLELEKTQMKLESEFKIKLMQLEHENKLKMVEKQKEIEFQQKIGKMAQTSNLVGMNREIRIQINKKCLQQESMDQTFITNVDRMIWGAEKYFGGKIDDIANLYPSYQEWYKALDTMLRDYHVTEKYIFARVIKSDKHSYSSITFVGKRFVTDDCYPPSKYDPTYGDPSRSKYENIDILVMEGINEELWNRFTLIQLHPTDLEKSTEMVISEQREFEIYNQCFVKKWNIPNQNDATQYIILGFMR